MIYECRINKVTKQHIYSTLLTVLILCLMGYFEIFGHSKYWWPVAIGFLLALSASYLIANTKVKVNIEGEIVTVYHDGMVQSNFSKDSIVQVTLSGRDNLSRVLIVTDDGRKIYIPSACFSDSELETMMNELGNEK